MHSHVCEATDPLIVLADTDTFPGVQDGAACCIIASEDFVHAHKLENQAIEIVAQALETDNPDTYDSESALAVVGYGMTKRCADAVFAQAGFALGQGRGEVGVIELHDCFAPNEVGVMVLHHGLRMTVNILVSLSLMQPWVFALQKWLTNSWKMGITR